MNKIPSLLLLFITLFCLNACKQKKVAYHRPKDLVEIGKALPSENVNKQGKIFTVDSDSSQVNWTAEKPGGGNYQGTINDVYNGVITLTKTHEIKVARIALNMKNMDIDNVSSQAKETILAQIKGLNESSDWGFKINRNPYMTLEILDSKTEGDKTTFNVNLNVNEITRSFNLTGKIQKKGNHQVLLSIDPFSIDLRQWFVFFKDDNTISPYMQFKMDFKADISQEAFDS